MQELRQEGRREQRPAFASFLMIPPSVLHYHRRHLDAELAENGPITLDDAKSGGMHARGGCSVGIEASCNAFNILKPRSWGALGALLGALGLKEDTLLVTKQQRANAFIGRRAGAGEVKHGGLVEKDL